ncbi:hypothetical protein GCM10011383_37660 [Hymenobacter cavernae]|uniref:Helix-turn-helix domain-containing protein n=1 Tax=Hymenobacter cavernae TaxID=2044852 RepID=A0ABQ1UMA1_9BACT|nr:hypothetical protein GCM10011383_37660 [Hymenobacter cavernae]
MIQENDKQLQRLLPHGSVNKIANSLGISRQGVYSALRSAKPNNRVVIEAVRIIKEAGTADVQRELTEMLTPVTFTN